MNRMKHCGFTLYELLITIVVLSVILALGIPNLGEFTRNSRVTATANDLHGSFLLARSEAARAKTNVTICASAEPFGEAQCNGASFETGWIIFVDADGDIERGANESVLRAYPPVDDTIDVLSENGATYFSFAANGLGRGDVNAGTNGPSFLRAAICDPRGNVLAAGGRSTARLVVVTPVGRSTVVRDLDRIPADACATG